MRILNLTKTVYHHNDISFLSPFEQKAWNKYKEENNAEGLCERLFSKCSYDAIIISRGCRNYDKFDWSVFDFCSNVYKIIILQVIE